MVVSFFKLTIAEESWCEPNKAKGTSPKRKTSYLEFYSQVKTGHKTLNLKSVAEIHQVEKKMENQENFGQMLNDSFSEVKKIRRGDEIEGEIVEITEQHIIVSIGGKQDAVANREEYVDDEGNTEFKIGDKIGGFVLRANDSEILIGKSMSKEHAQEMFFADVLEKQIPITGRVVSSVKGGFLVEVGLSKAFCPFSLIDFPKTADEKNYVDKSFDFHIIKIEKNNIVVSRKDILKKQFEEKKAQILKSLVVGQKAKGVVSRFTDFGAMVDLGGVFGFIHRSEVSWSRTSQMNKLLKTGQQIEVLVLKKSEKRIDLSIKQLTENPIIKAVEELKIGDNVDCKIVAIKTFGAFVEIGSGVGGLIPISQMSWGRGLKSPSEVVKVGDEIEAQILSIDKKKLKISLSLRALSKNPWEHFSDFIQEGEQVEGTIEEVNDFGLFLNVADGLTGLFPAKRMRDTKLIYTKHDIGKKITLRVDRIDGNRKKFSLDSPQAAKRVNNRQKRSSGFSYKGETNWRRFAKDKTKKDERIKSPFDVL